jgi:hypothetical protein
MHFGGILNSARKHEKLPFRLCFHADFYDENEQDMSKIIGQYIAYDFPSRVYEKTASEILD